MDYVIFVFWYHHFRAAFIVSEQTFRRIRLPIAPFKTLLN